MQQKLVIVISHPIQYHAPLYRHIVQAGRFDLHVIFINDRGARPYYEPLASTTIAYDNNLLEGYSFEFLTRGDPAGIGQKLASHWLGALERRILAAKPEAVYFHGYGQQLIPTARASRFLRRKHPEIRIFLRGENEDIIPRPGWKNLLREHFLQHFLKTLDAVLYIGQANKEFFLARQFPRERLFFVPYSAENEYFGINETEESRLQNRRSICRKYEIDPNGILFINTSKHRAEKNPFDLLKAYTQVVRESRAADQHTLLLVGNGPLHDEMQRFVRDAGIPSVRFAGYVSQEKLKHLLQAADYYVLPSEEPWGCVFNEALPAGLGIISSDRALGWIDLVRIGANGFTYRHGWPEALAAVLRECIRHPEWIPGFRQVSRDIARVYSHETCVQGICRALDDTQPKSPMDERAFR